MAIDNLKNIEEIKSDVGRVRGQRLLEKDRLLVDIPGIEGIDGSAGLIKLFVYDVDSDEILGQSIYLSNLNNGIDIAQDLIDLGFTSGKYRVVYNIVEEKLGTYKTRNYIVADPDLNEIYADAGGNWDNNWIEGSWADDNDGDGEYIGGGALWKGTYHVDNKGDLFTFTLDSDLSKPLYPIYNKCFIQEISPSRKEIRILPVNNNTNFIENIGVYSDGFDDDSINTSFGSFVSNTADNPQELKYLADFGDNFTPLIVNWEVDEIAYPEAPHSIVLRLYEPLSDNIKKHTQLTIVKELIEPIIEEVIISGQSVSIAGRDLGELISYEDSDTGWVDSSYGDLLTSNTYGQKDLEDLYSSGSDSAELNIDYSDYSNFINFSSAQTRLDNFRYKLQQIETYESKSLVAQQRRESLYVELVDNGDFSGNSANWEHYGINWTELAMPDTAILYHNDSYLQQEINSSENTTHKLKFKYKSNQQGIDNSAHFTASISGSSETIERHFTLDSLNYKTYETEFISPEDNFYIRFDTQDPWTYSWCILDYVSITKPSAPPDISYSRPTEEITKEIWRRIVNNLPYLYKTKGTLRGVKALLNCYGIPQNLLNITTDVSLDIVGSPRGGSSYDDWRQSYKRDRRFLYALDFEGGQFVTSSWEDDTQSEVATSRKPESIEFRFRTTHQTGSQTLLGTDDDLWGINLEQSASSDYGYVNFVLSGSDGYISSSTSKLSLYDGDFRSVLLKRSSGSDSNEIDQTYELVVKKFKNNQFTEAVSSSLAVSGSTGAVSQSYNTSFTTDTNFYIGGSGSFSASFSASLSASLSESVWETFPGTSQFGSFFQGSIQEFRLWNYDLSDLVFDNHVASPESYNADTISGSYDNLVLQYKFYTKTNHSSSFDVADGKPDQTYTNTGNANNYYVLTPPHYSGYSIEHQSLVPNFGYRRVTEGVTVIPNKSDYVKSYTLDTKRSSLKAAKDLYPKQTKTIDMSLKINAGVEKDMNNFLGALPSLDNYYSSENPMYADRYEKLDTLKDAYFKKHTSPKDTWKNIKLFMLLNRGLVEQIRNYMLPARSKLKSGLSIETHKLHRSKYTYKRPTIENPTYTSSIDTQPTVDGSFRYFTGSIDKTTISEGSGEYKYYHGSSSIQNDVTGTYDYYSGSEDTKPDATGTYNYYSGSEDTKPDAVGTYNYYSGSEDTKPNITGSYDYYSGSEDTKPDATGTYDYYSGSEDTKPNITGSYDYYSGSYDSITQNASTYQYTELHWNGSGYVVVSGSDDKTMAVMPFISGGRINNDYDLFSSQSNLTQNDYPTLLENYIPSDYQKPYSTAIQNLFYGGCVNTSASTWGIDDNIGEEPFGSWDTSDNVMKINESGKLVVK